MGRKKPGRKPEQPSPERRVAWPRWTGFGNKTVWDLLQLLIVPLMLAAIGFWFTVQQEDRQQDIEDDRARQVQKIEDQRAEAERELAKQRAQDEALQAYLDQMSSLMLNQNLLESERGDPVYTLAQARTATVMTRLDSDRNKTVLGFLASSGLAGKASSAESSVNLLRNIDLTGADLSESDLREAFIGEADLSEADLREADLRGAFLSDVDLSYVDLTDARGINLGKLDQQAESFQGATLPDGQLQLPAGEYATEKFKPALSFRVSEGWQLWTDTADYLYLEDGPQGVEFSFYRPSHVFDPSKPSKPTQVSAPENADEWASWFQRHPNLKTSKPVPVSVGGASWMRIDVTLSSAPENYPRDYCGDAPCVALFRSGGYNISYADWKDRFIIVDVKGEPVVIDVAAPVDKFDAFLPKAQKVLDTVEWKSE